MAAVDELCQNCSTFDLFSLFTGPRYFPTDPGGSCITRQDIGTLREIKANARCPLCRLVKHALFGSVHEPLHHPWDWMDDEEKKPGDEEVMCYLSPYRSDYYEEGFYEDVKTRESISTTVSIRLDGTAECSEDQRRSIHRILDFSAGIQLLSPDSIDPRRPLINGYSIANTKASLKLLSQWLHTCRTGHGDTCHDMDIPEALDEDTIIGSIRVINVKTREIQEYSITEIEYVALSYVWEKNDSTQNRSSIIEQFGATQPMHLQSNLPKIVEDALYVCTELSIPFLWVDLYCIDQHNPEKKAKQINGMGYIYHRAEITLIDGRDESAHSTYHGLFPDDLTSDKSMLQRIERLGNQRYITRLPGISFRLQQSIWTQRSWTFQEGHLSKRVAFSDRYDVTFMCHAGSWRESLHSGPYGHAAEIPQFDLRSSGTAVLAGNTWLKRKNWNFAEYVSILLQYTGRALSFESDKLRAIEGCFSVLERGVGLRFIQGIPSIDFHYALLWTGEEDRHRDGFASWSWAGWHSKRQTILVYPCYEASGTFSERVSTSGILKLQESYPKQIKIIGDLINGIGMSSNSNRCRQWLAPIEIDTKASSIKVTSEIVHLSVDVYTLRQAVDGDSEETLSLSECIILRSCSGQSIEHIQHNQHGPWPPTQIRFPDPIKASSASWLMREGVELIKILDIEMLEGDAGEPLPARRVFCLGVDRRQEKARRFGYVHMTGEIWDRASPRSATIELY